MVPGRHRHPAGALPLLRCHHKARSRRAARALRICAGRVLADGLSVHRGAFLRRQRRDTRSLARAHPQGDHLLACVDYRVFGPRSRSPLEWASLVWLPGAPLVFHLVCLPDSPHHVRGAAEHPALFPPSRPGAGARNAHGQAALAGVPGEDHRPVVLPAHAQHGEALAHHGGSARAQGVPVRIVQYGRAQDQALFACHRPE